MESTSNPDRVAQDLLECCLAGRAWPEHLLDPLVAEDGNRALFRIVVERLGDLFEPRLCSVYADLFADVIARRIPELRHAEHLVERYERIRKPRKVDREPASVFVLSRVTLGADVAITSVLLDAAKRRFPNAQIWFVGPHKSWELFAADRRLRHLPMAYGRSDTLDARLAIWPQLLDALRQPNSIVIDPDSRLTQLGLLPICQEDDYYFFESRSYGGDGGDSLSSLASRWAAETIRSFKRTAVHRYRHRSRRRCTPAGSRCATAARPSYGFWRGSCWPDCIVGREREHGIAINEVDVFRSVGGERFFGDAHVPVAHPAGKVEAAKSSRQLSLNAPSWYAENRTQSTYW